MDLVETYQFSIPRADFQIKSSQLKKEEKKKGKMFSLNLEQHPCFPAIPYQNKHAYEYLSNYSM